MGLVRLRKFQGLSPGRLGAIQAVGHGRQALRDKMDEFLPKGLIGAVTDAGSGWCS